MDELTSTAFERALIDPSRYELTWKARGELESDERLGAWAGHPDAEAVHRLETDFRRNVGAALDAQLRDFWLEYNGVVICPSCEGLPPRAAGQVSYADVADIGEPNLWPAGSYGDHFSILDIEVDGCPLFVFGEIADSGFFALAVTAGRPSPVYWQDVEAHLVAPHRLCSDFESFLKLWLAADLSLPLLLQQAGAAGWGA